MGWIFTVIFLTVIALVLRWVLREFAQRKEIEAERRQSDSYSGRTYGDPAEDARLAKTAAKYVLVGWIAVLLIVTGLASAHQIETGHVGIVYQFGEIVGQVDDGLQFTPPWQGVKTADIRVQKATFSRMASASVETQDVYVTATVNYSVSPQDIQTLYRTVGPNWFDRLVESRVKNFFKEETVKYRAVDITPNREQIRANVQAELTASLAPYSITVIELLIDNVAFNNGFTNAIEEKQIATQEALREQERVKQVEAEADQLRAQAQGQADATRIEAQGQADANRLLDQSLTPIVVQWQAVQKLNPNVQVVLLPSDSGNFLFDIGTLVRQQQDG